MKKIQLYVDEKKDDVVFDLVDRLEVEANNTRGYVQDKVKERLKAFEMLCKKIGTNDPMEVVMKYVEAVSAASNPPIINDREEAAAIEEPPTKKLNDFVSAAKNNFNFK